MASSGVSVNPECTTKFNELKLGKSMKFIIYKLSDDGREVVVEETSNDSSYDVFREKLVNSKSKDKRGKEGKGARYAVYDFSYEAPGGEGERNRILFLSWTPDDASIQVKMTYSASKESLKRAFTGIGVEIQANDEDDIEYETIKQRVIKGR